MPAMKYVAVNPTDRKWSLPGFLRRVLDRWKILAALAVTIPLLIAVFLTQYAGRDPQLHFQNGMAAAKSGDTETVLHEASRLLKTPGFESYGHMLRGTWFLETREYVAAANEFGMATDDPKTRTEAYTRRGEAFYRMHQFVNAEQMLLQALKLDADNSDARRWLASTYYDLGSMSLALEHLRIIGDMNADDGRPFRLIGRIEKDFQHHGEAIDDYREALRRTLLESEREAVNEELAECLVHQLQYSEALRTLQDAKPTAPVFALQAACYAALGDSLKAISKANDALHLNPDLVSAILTRASIELETGKAVNVIDLLERAAAAHPGNFEILFQLVKALRLAGRVEEADEKSRRLAELEKLVDEFAKLNATAFSDLGNADLRFQLGQLALKIDRADLARSWLEAALAIDPDLVRARNLLRELNAAQ